MLLIDFLYFLGKFNHKYVSFYDDYNSCALYEFTIFALFLEPVILCCCFQTEHIVNKLQEVYDNGLSINVTLQYYGGTYSQMKYWIQRQLHNLPCSYRPQSDGNLGQKLTSAVKDSFKRLNNYVIVIGKAVMVLFLNNVCIFATVCYIFIKRN